MKNVMLFIMMTLAAQAAMAQSGDSFIIKLGKEVVLRSPAEVNEPVITISKQDISQNKKLTIEYTTAKPRSDWKRNFFINDENEQTQKQLELKKQDGSVTFAVKDLQQAASEGKTLFIYTNSIPSDPDQAALVRVRRYFLCKIQWN